MIPVSGISRRMPPTMMNTWSANAKVSPTAASFEKPSCAMQRDPEAARDEEHVDEQQRRRADQPELLGQRRVDEVGVQVRDQLVPVGRS